MPRPKHTRRDANQAQLISELYQLGACYIWDLSDVGGDVLDLLILYRGRLLWLEVKRPGHEDELTAGEREIVDMLRREMLYDPVITSLEDFIKIMEDRNENFGKLA